MGMKHMDEDIRTLVVVLAGLILGAILVGMYGAGRHTGNLARMEMTAAIQTAKTEIGWQYERFRLQTLRMDWLNMDTQARLEYIRRWGTPSWAHASVKSEPPGDVAVVRSR